MVNKVYYKATSYSDKRKFCSVQTYFPSQRSISDVKKRVIWHAAVKLWLRYGIQQQANVHHIHIKAI